MSQWMPRVWCAAMYLATMAATAAIAHSYPPRPTRLAETTKAMHVPALPDRLSLEGAESASFMPEAFAAFIQAETMKWDNLVKIAGMARQ
jgi:hypothetical protein